MKSKVYFTDLVDPDMLVPLYKAVGKELTGNIAVKVHTGEDGNNNFLGPDFWRPVIDYMGKRALVVECNTAYPGARNTTKKHFRLLDLHRWTDYFFVDILDARGEDMRLPIPNGKVLRENLVGYSMMNYESMLVLSHFKGHPMGGFGGALKQLSIGCASSRGKAWIHSGGKITDQNILWDNCAPQDVFLEAMADAAGSVVEQFQDHLVFINVMKNLSVDCDCCTNAERPCMEDVGMLASLDPVALDQACVDLVYASDDPGKDALIERMESRHGIHVLEAAAELGYGSREYELIHVEPPEEVAAAIEARRLYALGE